MNKLTSALAMATVLLTSTALPAVADGPSSNWSGLYFGVHGGYGWSDLSSGSDSIDLDGGLIGGHIGYNWQWQRIVAGVEADGSFVSFDGKQRDPGGEQLSAENDWLASIRGRLGVDIGPALLYATAGVAWTDWSSLATFQDGGMPARLTLGSTGTGYVVGGGAEFALTQNMIARIEGLHYGFSGLDTNAKLNGTAVPAGMIPDLDNDITVVRGGLSYKF